MIVALAKGSEEAAGERLLLRNEKWSVKVCLLGVGSTCTMGDGCDVMWCDVM